MTSVSMSSSRVRAKYELQQVKDTARGLWASVHLQLCGIANECITTKHVPCPRHGGKDKWRVFDDYENTGGAVCQDCGKMADGLEVVRRFTGCSLPEAIDRIGDYLGLPPKENKSKTKNETPIDPAKNLEFHGPNDAMAAVWCGIHKKGIKPEALWPFGAQFATYRKRYPVFAIPIRGQSNETVGWCLYHATGKELPIFAKGSKQPVEWRKIKITTGSKPGWIGPIPKPTDRIIWKTEGPSCAMATYSLGLPEGHSVCCNAFGAEENPATTPWMLERFRDAEEVFVVHDSDKSGQRGATEVTNENGTSRPGWAPAIANVAKQVRNYVLPWPMVESHGQDLRDLIIQRLSEGLTDGEIYQHILANARLAPAVKPIAIKLPKGTLSTEAIESPAKITNCTTEFVESNGKKVAIHHPIPILDIFRAIVKHGNGFPKRAGNDLFVIDRNLPRKLLKPSSLFGWLRESIEVDWKQGPNLPTREEIFEILWQHCEKFVSVEPLPHFPRIKDVYYSCDDRPVGSGKYLSQFLDFFCPSGPIDRELLLAAVVTTFWGGHPGGRPGFQFSSCSGQGAGKTTAATTIAKLTGGSIDFDQSCKREEITKRLLSGETGCRVVLLDNIKAQTFSSASFESLITSKLISGHQMYAGNASKPNYFNFFVTFNSAQFSRDMAQRLVSIVLGDAVRSSEWQPKVDQFITEHHADIVDDVKAFFDRPTKKLSSYNRWATWQGEIISRLEDPESIIYELQQREGENDGDAKAACDVLDYLADFLMDFGYTTPYRVHIGFPELSKIVTNAIGSPHTPREAGLLIDRFISSGLIANMKRNQCHTFGKGFLYWSVEGISQTVSYDLSSRIEIRETAEDNAREKRRAKIRLAARAEDFN